MSSFRKSAWLVCNLSKVALFQRYDIFIFTWTDEDPVCEKESQNEDDTPIVLASNIFNAIS